MGNHKKKKEQHYGKTIKRLMGYVVGTFKLQFAFVFIAIILSALAGIAGPLFLMVLIDDYITPLLGQQTPEFTGLFQAILLLAAVYYIGVLCTFIYSRLMVNIGQGVLKHIRDDMFCHMQKLPIGYFDRHPHGELMGLYTNDTDTLRQMISQSIPQVFSSFVTVIAIFFTMVSMSIPLSILAILMVAIMIGLTKVVGGKSGKYFVAQQKDLGEVNAYVEEMMSGQKVIKVFCHEEHAKEKFAELNDNLCRSATEANKYANILMPIIANLGNLQYVLTVILGSILAIGGVASLTLGVLASFLQLTRSFNMPFSQISQQFNSIVMALAGAERIFNLMDEEVEVDDGCVTLVDARFNETGMLEESKEPTGIWAWKKPDAQGGSSYAQVLGDVRFTNMRFGYQPPKWVLKDLSLYAKPGQKIAFVGATGAGKTTITNLINRFYEIQEGQISYDGISIQDIKKADLRKSLGIVLQDTHLFTGTILENIRYGKLEATEEQVYEAGRLANADQFIRHLPCGYQTMLNGDGEELSQGQRQLLAIARAAVANPPVLILDEATSSIDTRTEAIVQEGMDALMKGRTVFVIAHRLSTIRNSDVIIVLSKGQIIERGDHEKLIKERGTYYRLCTGDLELD